MDKNQLTFCLSFYGRFLDFLSVEKKSSSRAVEQEQGAAAKEEEEEDEEGKWKFQRKDGGGVD